MPRFRFYIFYPGNGRMNPHRVGHASPDILAIEKDNEKDAVVSFLCIFNNVTDIDTWRVTQLSDLEMMHFMTPEELNSFNKESDLMFFLAISIKNTHFGGVYNLIGIQRRKENNDDGQ